MRPADHRQLRRLQRALREGEAALAYLDARGLTRTLPTVAAQREAFWDLRKLARRFVPGDSRRLRAELRAMGIDVDLRPISRVGAQVVTLCGGLNGKRHD